MDNLLSEMLLTVETLPDISYTDAGKNKQIEMFPTKRTVVNANVRTSPQRAVESNINTNRNAMSEEFKRSHVHQTKNYQFDAFGYKNQDMGETSSITTTTLTPTESRCNTPAMSDHQGLFKNYYHSDDLFYDTDTQMQLHSKHRQYPHSEHPRKEYQKQTENLLQNSSQSHSYMEVLRSENRSGDRFADSNIPYHAREYSKPFSYGIPSTGEGKMLKTHSGHLSSPSMVRKALNQNGATVTSVRKTPSHDFEERANYGRHVESKYTFGDKTPENNLSVFDNDKMFDYRNRSENLKYKDGAGFSVEHSSDVESPHFFEPLRRSNTMDGSFGRSGYASDG